MRLSGTVATALAGLLLFASHSGAEEDLYFQKSNQLIDNRDYSGAEAVMRDALADHPRNRQFELVYVGVRPESRGRGLGLIATRHAQLAARSAKRAKLSLAVDATNEPAVRIYHTAGFEVWDRRSVFLKELKAESGHEDIT